MRNAARVIDRPFEVFPDDPIVSTLWRQSPGYTPGRTSVLRMKADGTAIWSCVPSHVGVRAGPTGP